MGRRRLRALQRPVGDRAVGRRRAAASCSRAIALGVRPLYLCEHDGRLYFASEVKAIFAADPAIPRAFDPVGPRPDLHVLERSCRRRRVFAGVDELPPGPRPHATRDGARAGDRAFCEPALSGRPTSRRVSRARSTRRSRRCAARSSAATRAAHAARRRPGRQLPLGRARQLAGRGAWARAAKGERFQTFSLRFEDAEYDETEFQRVMVAHARQRAPRGRGLARATSPRSFPRSSATPSGRSCAPRRRRCSCSRGSCATRGIKVVLTGEGADEMFAGYDLFREGKVRRFWARQPGSQLRPRLLERLYPYLARSPVAQQAMARQFFGRNLERARDARLRARPALAQRPRALKRLFSRRLRARDRGHDVDRASCSRRCRRSSRAGRRSRRISTSRCARCSSGYLLSSQGDRMLMAHSVEGRFPFLDRDVVALADSLPAAYKLRVLDEKHVLKRVADGRSSRRRSSRRKKQPYRAPDALSLRRPRRARRGSTRRSSDARRPRGRRVRPGGGRAALAQVPRARRRRRSSRTPTTWRWSASCRPSSCSTSASSTGPTRRAGRRARVDVRTHRGRTESVTA